MADTPLEQTVRNWMLDTGERVRALERRYQELRELASAEDEELVFHNVRWFGETAVGSGLGATETVVGSLDVPAFSYPTVQIATLSFVLNPNDEDAAAARWDGRVRDTNVTGATRARAIWQQASNTVANDWMPLVVPLVDAAPRSVTEGLNVTYVATIERVGGAGTANLITGAGLSRFTVWVFP